MPSRTATLALLLVPIAACGSADEPDDLVFGAVESVCTPGVLTNDAGDDGVVATGSDCLLTEFAAGRPVVWDVRTVTVEGDPVPVRYRFDGETVTITTDDRRDEFGNGGVEVRVCADLRSTDWLPEGIDCIGADGNGFADEGLD